jgi:PAS domain S-box-containing protein
MKPSKAYLETIIRGFHDGIVVLDEEGRFEFGNDACWEILGWPSDEIIGEHLLKVVPPELHEFVLERWQEVKSDRGRPFEVDIVRGNRDRRRLLFSAGQMTIKGSRRYSVVIRDVTDGRGAEQELDLEKDRAKSYLRIAAVMIVAIDVSQNVVLANQKACDILGYPEAEIVGRNWFDFFIPKRERERVRAAFSSLMLGETEPAEYFENFILSRRGEERIIAWHNTTLRDRAGTISGTLSSGTDVTERKQAEEQLRILNETLEQRVVERTALAQEQALQLRALARQLTQAELGERQRIARVLHEHFQQLLSAARVHLGQARSRKMDPEQRQVLRTVDDIIREAILEAGSLAVELCPPVLYELGLTAALDWLAERMRELHGLRIRFERSSETEPADATLRAFLFGAVQELLYNVVKHAQIDRASVTIDRSERGEFRITVVDEGLGFDPGRIWTGGDTGSGFGLFSIRERLGSLGGRAEVYSIPGQGTRVSLCAPLKE